MYKNKTIQEYHKEYYEKNKDRYKKYYQDNKQARREYGKDYYENYYFSNTRNRTSTQPSIATFITLTFWTQLRRNTLLPARRHPPTHHNVSVFFITPE